MPEHVHLLVSEPERSILTVAIQMLKQITAQKLRPALSPKTGERAGHPRLVVDRMMTRGKGGPPALGHPSYHSNHNAHNYP